MAAHAQATSSPARTTPHITAAKTAQPNTIGTPTNHPMTGNAAHIPKAATNASATADPIASHEPIRPVTSVPAAVLKTTLLASQTFSGESRSGLRREAASV